MQNSYVNFFDLTDKIFLTLAIIILFTCLMYRFTQKLGKPMVVGGILAGLIISHIPLSVKYFDIARCTVVGNFGIVLFMMFVGSEFHFRRLIADKANILLPFILILVPFILGFIMYPFLVRLHLINAYGQTHKWVVSVFFGIAISMSTFSILIMFVNNTRLRFSRIGKIAIFCASFEEGAFWMIFGIVLVFFQKSEAIQLLSIIYFVLYGLVMLFVMPKLIKVIVSSLTSEIAMLGFIVGGCLLSAVVADVVNLHPIFGGFIFGVLLPKNNRIIHKLREYLLEFIIIILLPVYFVKTGIDASAHLSINTLTIFLSVAFIIVSLLGKYGGAFIVGRIWSFSNRESLVLGSLLSIRGTMEVAILNVGHEVGLINTVLYSALVVMTVITTWIATSLSLYFDKQNK